MYSNICFCNNKSEGCKEIDIFGPFIGVYNGESAHVHLTCILNTNPEETDSQLKFINVHKKFIKISDIKQ
jgi:hypothetical protein